MMTTMDCKTKKKPVPVPIMRILYITLLDNMLPFRFPVIVDLASISRFFLEFLPT
jgi:hypothetical protein